MLITNYLDTLMGQNIVLGGDFNLDANKDNKWINAICDLYGLVIKIKGITRVESGSCIDNYLTNMDGIFNISNIAIADHQAIIAKIKISNLKEKKSKPRFNYRLMKEDNWHCFKAGLNGISLTGNDLESKWSSLLKEIKLIVDNSFPIKESSKCYIFTMSQGLLKSRDKKNLLLKKSKKGLIDKSIYTAYNKIYRKLIKSEQTN